MDDDMLREAWRNLTSDSSESLSNQAYDQLPDLRRKRTSLTNLAMRYRRFMIVGFIMAVYCICLIYNPVLFEYADPAWLAKAVPLALMTLFLVNAMLDCWLMNSIRSIDVFTMPVSEVVERSLRCRRIHIRSVMVGLPVAFTVIFFFGWALRSNIFVLAGMICGGVIGLCIGITQLRHFLADYRVLSSGAS